MTPELCTKCGAELTYHHHWGDGPEHDEHTPERCLTMQLAKVRIERNNDIEEAYERGAADARAKLLAEVCAWLRASRAESHREAADAIEAKFKATDQPKEIRMAAVSTG